MKSLSLCLSVLLTGLSLTSTARSAHVDIKVVNDSSSKIHVYHYEDSKYHYHKTVKAGDVWEDHTETGENWAVSNPRTNRIVKALTVTKFKRVLRVDDEDLGISPHHDHDDDRDHGDRDEVKLTFRNETRADLDIYAYERFRYKYQGTIRSERSAVILLEEGQRWRAQSTSNGAVVDDGIAPGRDVRISIGGGHSHDHDNDSDHGRDGRDADVTVTVVNRSGARVSVYKESPGGRRTRYGSLGDDSSLVLETTAGTVWIFFNSETQTVIRTLEVPNRDGTLTIYPADDQQAGEFDDSDYEAPAPVRILRRILGRD